MKFLLVLALCAGMAHPWDIATSSGDDTLNFYTNEILTSTITIASRKLSALTYDEVHNMMLYVDKQTNNDRVCGYYLTIMENKCFTEGSGRNIYDLAFDPVTERLFFTDSNGRNVNWISLQTGSYNNVNLLAKVYNGVPRDVVMDSCNGYVYWLNTGGARPTIERVRVDGTGREVFETLTTIPVNAYYTLEPNGLAIDQHKQRIYWMEPGNITEYHLSTRLLNVKHTPYYMIRVFDPKHIKVTANTFTISKDSIFHLEYDYGINAVYSYSKIKTNETYSVTSSEITKKTMYSDRKMPISMVANYKIKDQIQDCEALNRVKLALECDGLFCVHGTKVNGQSACKCTPGYTGNRCDVSVCENYCFRGTCSINSEGLPKCSCNAGYTGDRCHVSVCESYCLQGSCSLNSEGLPECRCNVGYTGTRCEANECQGYCLNSGECSLNEAAEPSCECVAGYMGIRCEIDTNNTNH